VLIPAVTVNVLLHGAALPEGMVGAVSLDLVVFYALAVWPCFRDCHDRAAQRVLSASR